MINCQIIHYKNGPIGTDIIGRMKQEYNFEVHILSINQWKTIITGSGKMNQLVAPSRPHEWPQNEFATTLFSTTFSIFIFQLCPSKFTLSLNEAKYLPTRRSVQLNGPFPAEELYPPRRKYTLPNTHYETENDLGKSKKLPRCKEKWQQGATLNQGV